MSDFSLSEFIPYKLAILSASMSGLIAKEYESRFGLNVNQWRIIFILAEKGATTANEIAGFTLMDKMTISRALKKLAARDLIIRSLADEDSRKTVISLSKSGHSIHAEIKPLAIEYESRLKKALTSEELNSFLGIVDLLQRQVEGIKSQRLT